MRRPSIGDYVISQRKEQEGLPADGAFIKSIVSTNMADAIAKYYGIALVEVLTLSAKLQPQLERFLSFRIGITDCRKLAVWLLLLWYHVNMLKS